MPENLLSEESSQTSPATGRLNHPDDIKKYFSTKTYRERLLDKDNIVVACTLLMDGKDFLWTSSYEVAINQKTNGHDEFTITVPDDALDSFEGYLMENSKNILGNGVTIKFHQYGEITQTFEGFITKIKNKKENGYGFLEIIGNSQTIFLESGLRSRSFENQTLEQIIAEVCRGGRGEGKISVQKPQHTASIPYTVQYLESNYAFVQRLAKLYGEYFYYNGSTIIFGNAVQPIITLEDTIELMELETEITTKPQHFGFTAYDSESGGTAEAGSHQASTQYKENPFLHTGMNASKKMYTDKAESHYNHAGLQSADGELGDAARRERENRENLVTVHGKSSSPKLRVGGRARLVDINGHAMETYRILEVRHYHDGNQYYNEFVGIPDLFNAPYQDNFALPMGEAQPARVLDNNDPMGMGRLRVQFPWQVKSGEKTPWIRLVQPHSGSGKGFHFIPEVGEEVMVGFEGGNLQKPFVMGTHYNGAETSGYHTPDNDRKAIQTRSGNKFVMDDARGSIYLEDASGSSILMNGKRKISIDSDILEINVRQMIVNASQSTEITTNDYVLNALSRIYVFSNWMKQHINGFMHLFSNKALINSLNAIDIEAKETKLHGTEKALVHSDKTALVNSKGTAEMHGKQGIMQTNTPKEIEDSDKETIGLAIVSFRPTNCWNGGFGFDWLRVNDGVFTPTDDPAYADIIEGGYKDGIADLTAGPTGTAYAQLKTQYHKNVIKRKAIPGQPPPAEEDYFVPYLSLFSKEFVERYKTAHPTLPKHPEYVAKFKLLIEIEEDLDKIEFDYDKSLFSINQTVLNKKDKTGLYIYEDEITITCLKDLDSDKEIKIYAYPKVKSTVSDKTGNHPGGALDSYVNRKLAGRIIVVQNDTDIRVAKNIVFVEVWTDTDKNLVIEKIPFGNQEIINFYNSLHQALILPTAEKTTFDLSSNTDFQIGGNQIETNGSINNLAYLNKLDHNYLNPSLYTDTRALFLNVKNTAEELINAKYNDFFTIFKFGLESNKPGTLGAVQDIGIHNVIMFTLSEGGDDCTLNHETLHGLGLHHTHRNGSPIIEPNRKYVYPNAITPDDPATRGANYRNSTTNVMSYRNIAYSTWRWQWHIINPNISEK